jgi:membrane dipeptidase
VPYRGQAGYEGISVGTDYLELDSTVAEFSEVGKVAEWLSKSFSPGVAAMIGFQNARRLVEAAAGARD